MFKTYQKFLVFSLIVSHCILTSARAPFRINAEQLRAIETVDNERLKSAKADQYESETYDRKLEFSANDSTNNPTS